MTPLLVSSFTLSTSLGNGLAPTLAGLRAGDSGLRRCAFESVAIDTWAGEVAGVDRQTMPDGLAQYDCRNNRLALLALETDDFADRVRAASERYGARRVGVFLGTSTSGILQTELAYRRRDPQTGALPDDFNYRTTHNGFSLGEFVRRRCALEGPAMVVSTACSSAAKTFAAAARLIACDIIDAALVGGVDSLCLTTLYGFASLELTSRDPCRPYDAARNGLSVAEGAAFALLERLPATLPAGSPLLLGYGESSDAHHMSSPHPEGLGAQLAMASALRSAGVSATEIDYINLHGTATPANDATEGRAVAALFGDRVPCSSTKGATGHTLGAAGGVEALICLLALADGLIPGSPHTGARDPTIPVDYQLTSRPAALRRVLSNSFGFGGSNCSLVFGVAP